MMGFLLMFRLMTNACKDFQIRKYPIPEISMAGALPEPGCQHPDLCCLTHIDQQYTYFMGANRAKQLLAVVHQND